MVELLTQKLPWYCNVKLKHKCWDWRDLPPWTISSNILVQLGWTRTSTGKSLIRAFNASDNYQSVGRLLGPHQNLYSWALRRTKRALKPQLRHQRLETMKLYVYTDQRQRRYTWFTQKYFDIQHSLIILQKASVYWLWHWRRCGIPHQWPFLERLCLRIVGIVTRIHFHLKNQQG